MKAYIFPGQGSQFEGMGRDLYERETMLKHLFEQANDILGFAITNVMFRGTSDDLKQTRVTQPAIFIHSVAMARALGDEFQPDMVAGHSLGEFSALVAARALGYRDGLTLVKVRAEAMQRACEQKAGTMAAVLGMDDAAVEAAMKEIDDIVVPANFNSPGQLVISGTETGIEKAVAKLTEMGCRRAVVLKVGGAFHSPLMEPARQELANAINNTKFSSPICPIYQNVDGLPHTDPEEIKANLLKQLTSPVRWTQSVQQMIADGATEFVEVGPGQVLRGLVMKIDRSVTATTAILVDERG